MCSQVARIPESMRHWAIRPADLTPCNPLPMLDWLRERCSMFLCHPISPAVIKSQNAQMAAEGQYRPVKYPGLEAGKGYSCTYGFNLVVNARVSQKKQEALHDFYKFFISDPLAVWKETAPFALARRAGGWKDDPTVTGFPHAVWLLRSREEGWPCRGPLLQRARGCDASRGPEDHAQQC